jgi:hypothetical protein
VPDAPHAAPIAAIPHTIAVANDRPWVLVGVCRR